MNYVKHLSMALLVLGATSVFAGDGPQQDPGAAATKGVWDKVKAGFAEGTKKSKEFFDNYVYGKATWKTQLPLAVVLAGGSYALYKKSSRVKDFVDDSLESAGEGIRDIKDGKGNARRNAVLKLGGVVTVAYLADAAWNKKFRWIQA